MRVVVLMPTYNEIESLANSVNSLFTHQPEVNLVIIDDNSPDGTGKLADLLAQTDDRIRVIHRSGKSGLGKAYSAGFDYALEQGFDRIVQMDADGSHRPEDLGRLLSESADLVVGSRWVTGGEVLNWPRHRLWISRFGNLYARFAIGSRLKDVTAGYRNYSAEILRKLPLGEIEARGYGFQVEMTKKTLELGGVVTEVPITFVERLGGRSKMTSGIILEAFSLCTRWLIQRVVRR